MEQKPEFKLPITGVTECPTCGSTEGICRQYLEQLEKEGKIPIGSAQKGFALQLPVMAVLMSPLVATKMDIPILNIGFEVCAQCFTIYSTIISESKQPAQIQIQQVRPPGFGNPGKK